MRNDACVDVELGERLPAALAVHDDTIEAREEVAPQVLLLRRASRQKVVCSEDRRHARPQEPRVELRHEPLHVHDVRTAAIQGSDAEGMLDDLQGQPQPRAAEQPRGERVVRLAAYVPDRRRNVAEAEARREELDVGAGARKRRRELVVVRRRERGRVGEDDSHGRRLRVCRCSSVRGISSTAMPSLRSGARTSVR